MNASPQRCHPERSEAESKDPRLLFSFIIAIQSSRINTPCRKQPKNDGASAPGKSRHEMNASPQRCHPERSGVEGPAFALQLHHRNPIKPDQYAVPQTAQE
jgi:hypothetical protein